MAPFTPPMPHKFYKREYMDGHQYMMLIKYDPKHNWWDAELFRISAKLEFRSSSYESMDRSDKWETISDVEYYAAMDKFGRLMVAMAATELVNAQAPDPKPGLWSVIKTHMGWE
jgi:hypothetical protein